MDKDGEVWVLGSEDMTLLLLLLLLVGSMEDGSSAPCNNDGKDYKLKSLQEEK